jgi:hypothetical protein
LHPAPSSEIREIREQPIEGLNSYAVFWRHWTLAAITANGVPMPPILFFAQVHLLLPSKNLAGTHQTAIALHLGGARLLCGLLEHKNSINHSVFIQTSPSRQRPPIGRTKSCSFFAGVALATCFCLAHEVKQSDMNFERLPNPNFSGVVHDANGGDHDKLRT